MSYPSTAIGRPEVAVRIPVVSDDGSSVRLVPCELDNEHWNASYQFCGTIKQLDGRDRRLSDPSLLVIQAPFLMVVNSFRHYTMLNLRSLAIAHGEVPKGRIKRRLEIQLSHHICSPACESTMYSFKELKKTRVRKPWMRFVNVHDSAMNRLAGEVVQDEVPCPMQRVSIRTETHDTNTIPTSSSTAQSTTNMQDTDMNAYDDQEDTNGRIDISHLDVLTDDARMEIIREWQQAMDLTKFVKNPCACCSTLVTVGELHRIGSGDVDLSLLQNNELPLHLLPTEYDLGKYRGAILDSLGVGKGEDDGYIYLCHNCLHDLRRGLMPRFALANWLYYARDRVPYDIKQAFEQLSPFEKALVCRVRTNNLLCRFSGFDEDIDGEGFIPGKRHIRGNVISTPLDVMKVNDVLPPAPESIRDTICAAIMVSGEMPSRGIIDGLTPILVRKSRVKKIIEFLIENNPHYSSSTSFGGFSVDNLNRLFDQEGDVGIPSSVKIAHLPTNAAEESLVEDYTGRLDGSTGILMENVAYTLGDMTARGFQDMALRAIQNCREGKPFVYARPGSDPAPDINNPNWLSWAHPNADPFGIGGFHEPRRKRPISMEQQMRHLLTVRDRQFESDHELAFDVYNIIRKASVNTALRFCVPYKSYERIVDKIARTDRIRLADLRQTMKDDPNFKPADEEDKQIMDLVAAISPLAKRIPGSVSQRIKMRNEIRALISQRGSPTLFITVNPADYENPIVTVLGRRPTHPEEIANILDIDKEQRIKNALQHPAACAEFFDVSIRQFINIILGYRKGKSKPGVFGICEAYYGTVETQGRGTLHCHMLVWLKGHPAPEKLDGILRTSDEYRRALIRWLDSITDSGFLGTRSYLNKSGQTDESGMDRFKEPHPGSLVGPIATSNRNASFDNEAREFVDDLLSRYNWHTHRGNCWKYLRPGEPKVAENCRFGMDGSTRANTEYNQADNAIVIRRKHPLMTSYNPILTLLMKCNTDVKFVGSGEDGKAFMYYVTDYITKAPLSMHAGLVALSYAIRQGQGRGVLSTDGMTESATKKAMTIAINSMLGHQEISHPQAMSYLLGTGEYYTSEQFASVNWAEIKRFVNATIEEPANTPSGPDDRAAMDSLNISVSHDGNHLNACNMIMDYAFRPKRNRTVDEMCLYNFIAKTRRASRPAGSNGLPSSSDEVVCKQFCSPQHPQYESHILVTRSREVIPVLLGPRIAGRNGTAREHEEWAKDMCILFRPWRNPRSLKDHQQNWTDVLNSTIPMLTAEDRAIIDNMSLMAEAKKARDSKPRKTRVQRQTDATYLDLDAVADALYDINKMNVYDILADTAGDIQDSNVIPVEALNNLKELIGMQNQSLLRRCMMPNDEQQTMQEEDPDRDPEPMDVDPDPTLLREQKEYMAGCKNRRVTKKTVDSLLGEQTSQDEAEAPQPSSRVGTAFIATMVDATNRKRLERQKGWGAAVDIANGLGITNNEEQLKAFNIIADRAVFGGPQLMMYVGGKGGTGKSYLINAVVTLFERLGRSEDLRLAAPTGIAASLIGGNTLHSLLHIGVGNKSTTQRSLSVEWSRVRFLVVDEVSMVGANFMASISSRMKKAKGDTLSDSKRPFGGVNMIFMGDFCQLAPPKQPSLFSHKLVRNPTFIETRNNDGIDSIAGAYLWRMVDKAVILTQNKRHADDPILAEILEKIRTNSCIGDNGTPAMIDGLSVIDQLRGRTMNAIAERDESTLAKFHDAPVIVGSKILRDSINVCLLSAHASELAQRVDLYYSTDLINTKTPPDAVRRYLWDLPSQINGECFGQLPMFKGMKVMITENISIPHKIVNGTEGVIEGIEHQTNDLGLREAQVVYVKVPGCTINAPGREVGTVPLFPTACSIKHSVRVGDTVSKSFRRKQIPIVPAYSYTDYKSQGRTLEKAIVDVASSRGQGTYVMLSRVKKLEGLMILRWFPASKIIQRMSGELRDELQRIQRVKEATDGLYENGLLTTVRPQ